MWESVAKAAATWSAAVGRGGEGGGSARVRAKSSGANASDLALTSSHASMLKAAVSWRCLQRFRMSARASSNRSKYRSSQERCSLRAKSSTVAAGVVARAVSAARAVAGVAGARGEQSTRWTAACGPRWWCADCATGRQAYSTPKLRGVGRGGVCGSP